MSVLLVPLADTLQAASQNRNYYGRRPGECLSDCEEVRNWRSTTLTSSTPKPPVGGCLRVPGMTSLTMAIASFFLQQLQRRHLRLSADQTQHRPPILPPLDCRLVTQISPCLDQHPVGAAAHRLPAPSPSLLHTPFIASSLGAVER